MKSSILYAPLAGLLALGLTAPAFADPSVAYPTYTVGPQGGGATLMSTGQIITPTGKVVDLGTGVRAKAIAINPNTATHSAAVLTEESGPVSIFDLDTGEVKQVFKPTNTQGSYGGIAYTPDGMHLLFSQDVSASYTSGNLFIANVDNVAGLLTAGSSLALPVTTDPIVAPNLFTATSYPGGIAVSQDGKTAYVILNGNNTLAIVDISGATPVLKTASMMGSGIRVGNSPNSVLVNGNIAYVSNEGGRIAQQGDFTDLSDGTPIVADPQSGASITGTVSVVDVVKQKVIHTIHVGLHPTGMAMSGTILIVANAYSDSLSMIDTTTNAVVKTIHVPVPIGGAPFGMDPTSLVVVGGRAYVTLYDANAIAVIDLSGKSADPVLGYIPTASTPSTIVYDAPRNQLVVSNDKGVGTQGTYETDYGVSAYNTHHDQGVVNLVPIPSTGLPRMTMQVKQNNHWDLAQNIVLPTPNPNATPVAIPAVIGEPSLIKHVFLIIKENRTYDQVLGDVAKGNGDANLAVFGAYTPNQHALVQRFPLLDNVYAPSRQSADGHPWILQSMAPYADDIQSPDWIRSYPGGNSNDALAYTHQGWLWQAAMKATNPATKALNTAHVFGEWSLNQTITCGTATNPVSWIDWYNAAQNNETGSTLPTGITGPGCDTESAPNIPSVNALLEPHYPSFNTGIPDQYRVDQFLPVFNAYEANNTLPNFTIIWLPDDHTSGFTTGYPIPQAAQADNDLALGRLVEAISHSKDWPTTAIFVEEDDAQNGTDHVDGHRQPVYVFSPYAVQNATTADHTFYNAASINRTIEHILGFRPLLSFDRVASPMTTAFTNTPNLAPFTHVAPTLSPNTCPGATAGTTTTCTLPTTVAAVDLNQAPSLAFAWNLASNVLYKGKTGKADLVSPDISNHLVWYAATNFARPYAGETKVLWPQAFKLHVHDADTDD